MGDEDGASWWPVGEVRMPAVHEQMHLSMSPSADAVYVSSVNGEVLKWPFGSAEPVEQAPALQSGFHTRWHSSCPLGSNHLVQLATQSIDTSPKLYVMTAKA